jgi:Arm DNA-binding domain
VPDLTAGADLLWDDEARGLCLRVYGDGSKSFIFVYCIHGHQRFIRIGQSPAWSLEAARMRTQELRAIVDQGHDPRLSEYRERAVAKD